MSEIAEIRKYLQKHYSDQDISDLCKDHFPEVYNNFSTEMTKQWKIHLLLDHCDRHGKLQHLKDLLNAREKDIGVVVRKNPLGAVLWTSVALIAVVIAALNIPWVQQQIMTPAAPTPTLFPIEPVQAGETLILIGSFDDRATNTPTNVEVMRRTYDELVKLSQDNDLPGLKVEWVPEPTITTEQEAMDVGRDYGAKLVIWGWKDDAGAFIQGTRTDNAKPATIHGSEVNLLNQTTVPICLSREVPSQGNYIALFTLGQGLIEWDSEPRVRLAMSFVDLALAEIEKRPISKECSAFNPWNGYGIRGHLYGTIALFLANENNLEEAISWRNKSIAAYDTSLDWKQDEAWVLYSKGVSQGALAELLAQQGKTEDAIAMQQAAIASYDAALQVDPDFVSALGNKGYSQSKLADLLAQQGKTEDAIAMQQTAIASFDAALQVDPDFVLALNGKGNRQGAIADLLAQQGKTEDAIAMRRESIASYDAALQVDPDFVGVLNNKGYSQEQLAHLLMEQGEQEEALSLYRAAVDSYNAALAIDQSLQVVKGHKERVLQQLEQMGVEY